MPVATIEFRRSDNLRVASAKAAFGSPRVKGGDWSVVVMSGDAFRAATFNDSDPARGESGVDIACAACLKAAGELFGCEVSYASADDDYTVADMYNRVWYRAHLRGLDTL